MYRTRFAAIRARGLRLQGVLPAFLRELAAQAGDDTRLAPFVELLARGNCPEGAARFVASVPGTHSRQKAARLRLGRACRAAGSCTFGQRHCQRCDSHPFRRVVESAERLIWHWCTPFEGSPDRIRLVWIDRNHPWARTGKWLLPEVTLRTLTELDATLLETLRP